MNWEERPDPDALLEKMRSKAKGELKIFFGYSAGVGKTYAMLEEAKVQSRRGVDVLVGYVEPHSRPETIALMDGLTVLPPQEINYKTIRLKDFDLDKALEIHPELILVDELAHTNPPGFRNKKRYQDIEELLNAGINVYTTINVQHVESLKDVVGEITKISVKERVPDYFLDSANKIELIDIDPEELLRRFEEGKIYVREKAQLALKSFFTYENLAALREIAMRRVADRITRDITIGKHGKAVFSKLMVCVSPSPSTAQCIRTTAIMAEAFRCQWVALYVKPIRGEFLTKEEEKSLQENMDLAEMLGGEIVILQGDDLALVISKYAKLSGITNVVIGKPIKRGIQKLFFHGGLEDELLWYSPEIDVHMIPYDSHSEKKEKKFLETNQSIKNTFSFSWRDIGILLTILILATVISEILFYYHVEDQNIIMIYILSVVIISRLTNGYLYGILGSIMGVLLFTFFFTPPYLKFYGFQASYPVTFFSMLMVALMTSALTNGIKMEAKAAIEGERRTEILYRINQKLSITTGLENIISLTNDFLIEIFEQSVIFYYKKEGLSAHGVFTPKQGEVDQSYLLEKEEEAVAYWVFTNGKPGGLGTDTLSGAKGYYIPIIFQGKVLGVLGIASLEAPLSSKQKSFLKMLLTQIGFALERQRLFDEQIKKEIEEAQDL
ncbi:MAG: DUF4118 domain-containing protein [Eubacteriaceae bacterium]